MKRVVMVGLVLVVLLGLVACAAPRSAESDMVMEESLSVGSASGSKGVVTYTATTTVASAGEDEYSGERMIVRTGDVSLVVADVAEALDEIAAMAVGSGGYVVSSRLYGDDEDRRGSISIRVPDEGYDSAIEALRDLAVRVESERTYSEDVTEQYVDLQSRLKNAEATEAQYLALLEEAKDVEDILNLSLIHI